MVETARVSANSVEETTIAEFMSKPAGSGTKSVDELVAVLRAEMKLKASEIRKKNVSIRPPVILADNGSLFQPQILSIGPKHRGLANTNVINMENLKWIILNDLFPDEADENLRECVERIKNCEERMQGCYERNVNLSSDEFVQILLLDSIFIMFAISYDSKNKGTNSGMISMPSLLSDLLLVENQIPLDIIRELSDPFAVADGQVGHDIASILQHTIFWKEGSSVDLSAVGKADHLLELYYKCNVPLPKRSSKRCCFESWIGQPQTQGRNEGTISGIQSAIDLYEIGIKFKPKKTFLNMFDVSFKNGILEIPTLIIDSDNMAILANLLSFEFCFPDSRNCVVASFAILMDSLINTKKDIALLQKCGGINNRLGSNDEAAKFFNSLGGSCRVRRIGGNFYKPIIDDMIDYSESKLHRNCTSLKHTYFSNPWTGNSVFAGSSFLALAVLQTVYTVYIYYHPH